MSRSPLEVRYSQPFHLTLAVIGFGITIVAAGFWLLSEDRNGDRSSQFWLMAICAAGLLYYAIRSVRMIFDRRPQLVVDRKGIRLGFGRDVLIPWKDVQWVRTRGLRPMLQIGIPPETFVALRLSMWNLDDSLTPPQGAGSAVGIRGNGLDTSIADIATAIDQWNPHLKDHPAT